MEALTRWDLAWGAASAQLSPVVCTNTLLLPFQPGPGLRTGAAWLNWCLLSVPIKRAQALSERFPSLPPLVNTRGKGWEAALGWAAQGGSLTSIPRGFSGAVG